ncbi:MAG: S-layer protein domain-containing protein [Euryarchaeota archaeon]|nr:S-layer protein domain-containing protein [Euryarchaeota archaeon]
MNKRMIILISLVVMAYFMPASAETLEMRGTIEELDALNPTLTTDRVWNYSSFAGFWYDMDDNLQTESLTILASYWGNPTMAYPYDRTLDEGTLIYRTHPVFQEYELYENEGLTVESDNLSGDTGYYAEGWMAEEYVAIDNNADRLCKLLVEFEDDETKTLILGEGWNLIGGFVLELTDIDEAGENVTLQLSKDCSLLDTGYINTSTGIKPDRVYTYTAEIDGESNIPVCSCYVDDIFGENETIRIKYLFLINNVVTNIESGMTYDAMEVTTASSQQVVLKNDDTTIDLDIATTEPIMGNMYFKTADDNVNDHIRFYPFVEYTEPGTYEVRGTLEELDATNPLLTINTPAGTPEYEQGYTWDYSTFAGVWYDLDDDLSTETLTILAKERDAPFEDTLSYPGDREIGEGSLIYKTHPMFHEYEMHQDISDTARETQTDMEEDWDGDGISDKAVNGTDLPDGTNGSDLLDKDIGLCVESDNPGGDCGYFIEGWNGAKYVAIDGNANKLCKLLVEFEDDDKKILRVGEKWDLGGGFALEIMGIDDEGDKVMFQLFKNNISLDMEPASTGAIDRPQERVYTYTADIGGEKNIPVFSCYVDAIFKGSTSYVQLMYVFLIDDDVVKIKTSQIYGAMEVMTASANKVVLTNDETAIDLAPGTTKNVTDSMYFKIADNDTAIRFYPFVERTIGGEGPTPPATIPATDSDHDGVPDVWDTDNSTPPDYWVNSDGIGRMWGDMNGDGKLTSADALMILQAAVENVELG